MSQIASSSQVLASGLQVGKYRLSRRIGTGSYGDVWKARDTIEGIWVALKIPRVREDVNEAGILREVRLIATLRHPNILPLKNADIVDGRIVLATELSVGTLADRSRPMSPARLLPLMQQVLEALAHAHAHRVMHCDVSPSNIFLFSDGRAALGDFGISRHYQPRMATMDEFGTPGYVAPEQAYGKPRFASDCFSAGLILYEYLTGVLPNWPFEWPFRGVERLQRRTTPGLTRVVRKALEVGPRKRYHDADEMLGDLKAAVSEVMGNGRLRKAPTDWRRARRDAYLARYGRVLDLEFDCATCCEPISEIMSFCPWCGEDGNCFDHATAFPTVCPDCSKGAQPDWEFCAWCYGAGFANVEPRGRADRRYRARCAGCKHKIMPFMHFCPWCRAKVRRPWRVHPFPDRCPRCKWSVDSEFWSTCPWCRACLSG